MLHIYTGDGKGKTTAVTGLAVRAAGRGLPVCFAQFLKDGSSGEMDVLRSIPGVVVLTMDAFYGFTFRMTEEERQLQRESCQRLLRSVREWAEGISRAWEDAAGRSKSCSSTGGENPTTGGKKTSQVRALIVLDEGCAAVAGGMLTDAEMAEFLDGLPDGIEVAVSGRGASDALCRRADYISRIACGKHPYERGIPARRGVEF